MKRLPNISNSAFWDVKIDFNSIEELRIYNSYIIGKIFDFGTYNDIIEIIVFYGKPTIKREIVKLTLKNKTIEFCCVLFNLKNSDFKCYRKRQSHQELWNY
jgi:hypothetical protein